MSTPPTRMTQMKSCSKSWGRSTISGAASAGYFRLSPGNADLMTTTIYLVRHGATDWNINKRAQGTADIPLNERGEVQALHAAEELSKTPVDAVYTSDLQRASFTADAIAQVHGLPVVKEPRFREIDQGDW